MSNPVPSEFAFEEAVIEDAIAQAVKMAEEQHISGEKNTPFLLSKVNEITKGESLKTNMEIIRNNAKVAAIIAKEYYALLKD